MKNILRLALLVTASVIVLQAKANTIQQDTTKFSTKVKTGLNKAGNKTAEVAANAAAAVADKTYAGKCGPHGQTVYINKNDHYYYINSTGHKVFLKKSQLRNKPTS